MPISLHRLKYSGVCTLVSRSLAAMLLLLLWGTPGHAQSGIKLVQHRGIDAGITTTASLAFASANTAGNWIGVAIRGGMSSSQVFTIVDSNGNTYKKAAQVGFTSSAVTLAIYYAENIKGGANTVTVSETISGPFRIAILEYSGVATSNSVDVAAATTGTSTSPNSGNLNTTASGDLLLGAVGTADSETLTAGSGYTIEDSVPAAPNTKLITEDQIQAAAGVASATATLTSSDAWGVVLAAFKSAGGVISPTITGLSPTAGSVGTSVTIAGANFGSSQGSSTVTFNGTTATPTSWSATSIVAPVPAGATTGNVVVTVGGLASNPLVFTVTSAPIITSVTPTSGPVGTSVTIAGANFGSSQGSSTVTFNGATATPTSWGATTIVVPVPAGANTGNIVVTVGGVASNAVPFSVTVVTSIKLAQTASLDAGTTTTASLAFTSSNTAGNWIGVVIRAGLSSSQVFAVTDSNGNTYRQAVQLGLTANSMTIAIYYAENIKGGANTVTVSDTVSGPLRIAILEYSGIAMSSSLDGTAMGQGVSATPSSGNLTTAASGDLLLSTIATVNSGSFTPGTGYTIEDFVPAPPNTKLIAEDQIQASSGTVSAGATLATSDNWGAVLVAVKAPGGVAGGPSSITATAGTPQSTGINTAFAIQLQATVKDPSNNPVSGVTVTFTAPTNGASGSFAGGAKTATTNAQGVATAPIFTANSVAGAYNVSASVTGVAAVANFSLTNLSGAASVITAAAGTPQSATVNTAFGTQLQATVKDSFNNPVSGVTVTFAAPSSGASGTFAGGVNTATTNAQGVATAAVFTANSTAGGPYTVTATATGVGTPANFSLTNTASVAVNISLVQHTSLDAGITTTGSLAFTSSNTAGNWVGVLIRAGLSSSQVFTVKDSNGNTYNKAAQIGFTSSAVTLAIYYAENIKGGANTVTVTDTVSGPLRIAILEYSGVATSNSVDASVAATGTSASPNSGSLNTTASGDLLLAAVAATNSEGFAAASGYTLEDSVPAPPNTKLITEDQIQASAGAASAGATLSGSDTWGAVLAAFKSASAGSTGPSITSLSQTTGAVGLSITITGTNFGATQGTSTVTFNGTTAAVSTWSSTSIVVTVPTGATTGPVVVTVGGVTSNGVNFTVIPTPNISNINPASGPFGTSVTITGTNFGASQGSSTVTFNAIAGSPTSWSATSIVVPAPNGATTGNVVVTVAGSVSNGALFTVTTTGPSISSLSLTQGPVGATFTVNGSNFGATQGSSSVTLNGAAMTAVNWTASSMDVTVPTGATTGNVVITVNGVASNGVTFTVTPAPAITSINPTAGPVGTNVIITGTNFGPTVGSIQSFVTFNGVQPRASNWTNTSITAPVPTGATTGNVVVDVGGVPSNGVLFTVGAVPSITSLNPIAGAVGTSVTITGANFGASQGTSTIKFNGTAATPTSWNATSIVAPVPTGATTGNVVVAVNGIVSNGVNFTVTTSNNISLVQHRSLDAGTATSGSLAFTVNNTAGNWIGVVIRAGLSSSQVFTVTDTNGNTYQRAFQLGVGSNSLTFALYYAENIKAGANIVTVSDTVSAPFRFAILEYSGVATSNSLDATPATAQGSSSTPNSGSLTTGAGGDLLLGTVVTVNSATMTAGSGYTIEEAVPGAPNTKLVAEDQLQTTAGSASASASLASSDTWGAGLAAFRSINGTTLPITISVSPTAASVPSGYGTQNVTATVANDFQNRGATWSLSGAGCSGSTCGTLSGITTTSVTYNAPPNVPSPATVTLTATAVGDTTKTASATITVTQGVINVAVSPRRAAVTLSASQTVQFTANVVNDPSNAGVTWQVDGNNGGNATTGTVSATGLYTPGMQAGQHTVTAVSNANANVSASAIVAVTDLTGVYTQHNDPQRTGQNVNEYGLTPATVSPSTFGQLFSCPVDSYVYAQPLWVANLNVGGKVRNVVFIATEHDSVYAFDADSPSCVQLWQVNFLGTGVTTMGPSDLGGNTDITPEIGITSTPVIDPATNTLYVTPKTKETVGTVNGQACSTASPCYVHRLHALDLFTGAEKFGGPVVISATNFNSFKHLQRPALLLANNTLYIAFGSHGDQCPYQGWVMGYNPSTLTQVFAQPLTVPPPSQGCTRGGIWLGGAGPAADANGNVYVSLGNGSYDGNNNFGDSAVKLSPTGSILDWFTPFNQSVFLANDIDLASSGIVVLPNSVASTTHPNLAIATGKVAILYLLDISQCAALRCAPGETKMGKFNSSTDNDVQEVVPVPPPNTTLLDGGNYGVPAYWNGNIYTTGQNFPLSQFHVSNGTISTPQSAQSTNTFPPRGGTPGVSANGTTGGVVWIIDYTGWQANTPAILDAYDANNVGTLLYSSPTSGTGAAGPAVKFTTPTVANGRAYVGTQFGFSVYGMLP